MQKNTLNSPEIALLRDCALIDLDQITEQAIRESISNLHDWQLLINLAEKHGLSNLLFMHLRRLKIKMPTPARQQLLSLQVRHRRANQARIKAIREIVGTLNHHRIDNALLKGAALIHVLYPSAELRPMSDIDILVNKDQAENAQQRLRDLGYVADSRNTGFLAEHHHLPTASRTLDSIPIHVEIHHDALSGDVKESIRLDNLSESLIEITVENVLYKTLGHTDMLRHLCHHMLEPVVEIKLGAIADIYGYACRYRDELNTRLIDRHYPFVTNVLALLHYITPLPVSLRGWIPIPSAAPPQGVGLGYRPMSQTMAGEKNPISRIKKVLEAPDWWLHGFYLVAPDKSLFLVKWWRHPVHVLAWLMRRIRAKHKDKQD